MSQHLSRDQVYQVAKVHQEKGVMEIVLEFPELSEHLAQCGTCSRSFLDAQKVISFYQEQPHLIGDFRVEWMESDDLLDLPPSSSASAFVPDSDGWCVLITDLTNGQVFLVSGPFAQRVIAEENLRTNEMLRGIVVP